MKKRKKTGFDLKTLMIGISIILMPLLIYILYIISTSTNQLISISIIALILGAVIENKRLTPKWSTVLYTVLPSLALSFFCFLPSKHEPSYVLENHIIIWPYLFLIFFVVISYIIHRDKIIPKMSEGKTLVLSIGIIYWVFDHGFYNTNSDFLKTIMIIGFVIAGFSIINAFVNIQLSKSLRLFLSIWSSIILILLAFDNIYLVYQSGQIENSIMIMDKIAVGLKYFLLGISSVYILQNVVLVVDFLPSRNRFFNKEYFEDVRELKRRPVDRGSDKQCNDAPSSRILILFSVFLIVNFNLHLLPRPAAISLVCFLLNSMLYFYEYSKNKTYQQQRT